MTNLPRSVEQLSAPSDYMEEVLATPPRWIVRWGELLVFMLVSSLFLLGWFIQYPDRIPGEVVITTPQPPVPVIAKSDGTLTQLLVHDHDSVSRGQLLAIIKNPAQYSEVLQLKRQLSHFEEAASQTNHSLPDRHELGILQEPYAQLVRANKNYQLYRKLTPDYQQQLAIEKQLQKYQALREQKQTHQQLLKRKVLLAEKDYRRNEQLHASQTIADKALEDSERQWLEAQESYEVLTSELIQLQVQVTSLEREGQRLSTQHELDGEQLHTALPNAIDNMQAAIAEWEERYLLTASRSGFVSFTDFWSEHQSVRTGQEVMSIIPEKEQQPVGWLRVPIKNFGKVAIGQQVKVNLENYPQGEYGSLEGIVHSISPLPKQGYYRVTVTFPKGLTTQYNKAISFQQQLSGQAEIITADLRLLERLFYQFRTAFKAH
jgi:multidrug resistance efflux pump